MVTYQHNSGRFLFAFIVNSQRIIISWVSFTHTLIHQHSVIPYDRKVIKNHIAVFFISPLLETVVSTGFADCHIGTDVYRFRDTSFSLPRPHYSYLTVGRLRLLICRDMQILEGLLRIVFVFHQTEVLWLDPSL